jgi:hypothetical protein
MDDSTGDHIMIKRATIAAVLSASLAAPVFAQQATDREKIVDVAGLRAAMDHATSGIRSQLEQSTLPQKFETVSRLLRQPDVDKSELVAALQSLQGEMDAFTVDWETDVAGPLWDGQETLAGTIDRVRMILAKTAKGKPSTKVEQRLAYFDKRLESLAKAIKSESDETRRLRLKTVFSNVLALRKLVAGYPKDVGTASDTVHLKLLQALTTLESQLLGATFQIERARVVLEQESEIVGLYVGVLDGVLEAEALLAMMSDMQSGGVGLGEMVVDLDGLEGQIRTFASATDGFLGGMADTLQQKTEEIAVDMPRATVGADVEQASEQYASRPETPSPPPSKEDTK